MRDERTGMSLAKAPRRKGNGEAGQGRGGNEEDPNVPERRDTRRRLTTSSFARPFSLPPLRLGAFARVCPPYP